MTKEEINQLLRKAGDNTATVLNISLKKRNTIKGFIVKARDYQNLNAKNYWHVLKQENESEWLATSNPDLLLLFPGDAFLKISML